MGGFSQRYFTSADAYVAGCQKSRKTSELQNRIFYSFELRKILRPKEEERPWFKKTKTKQHINETKERKWNSRRNIALKGGKWKEHSLSNWVLRWFSSSFCWIQLSSICPTLKQESVSPFLVDDHFICGP